MDYCNLLYFVYGLCIMFHIMMAWIFCHRQRALVKRLIGVIMIIVAVQYAKDLFLIPGFYSGNFYLNRLASSLDIVTVPLYALVLIELCRPKWLNLRRGLLVVAPFMVLSLLSVLLRNAVFFYALVSLSVVYGACCALWTLRELPVYHRRLKEEYSYDEDINLHWIRGVMVLFFAILLVWLYCNVCPSPCADILYMLCALVGWAVVCYFIYKQESVFKEVRDSHSADSVAATGAVCPAATAGADGGTETGADAPPVNESMAILGQRIQRLFDEERVYLSPKLRLSELAQAIGTNRTYLSQYFNQSCAQSFYDYVNAYRVDYAKRLLAETDYTLEVIASMSGFNSLSTFRRAFVGRVGCSPQNFRR